MMEVAHDREEGREEEQARLTRERREFKKQQELVSLIVSGWVQINQPVFQKDSVHTCYEHMVLYCPITHSIITLHVLYYGYTSTIPSVGAR